MASSSFISVHPNHHFSSNSLCKFSSTLPIFNCPCFSRFPTSFPPKHTLRLLRLEDRVIVGDFSTTGRDRKLSKRSSSSTTQKLSRNGSRHLGHGSETLVKKSVEELVNLGVEERNGKRLERDKNGRDSYGSADGVKIGDGISFLKSKSDNGSLKVSGGSRKGERIKERIKRNLVVEEREKLSKGSNEIPFRANLDMCSKTGDFMGAIKLYEWAQREGIKLEQYHYAVILYLCSSAALGVIQPAKSGNGNRTLSSLTLSRVGSDDIPITLDAQGSSKVSSVLSHGRTESNAKIDGSNSGGMVDNKDNLVQFTNGSMVPKTWILDEKSHSNILVDEDFKKYALEMGFKIYEKMCEEKIPMNEATLTSVARMAMSMNDGDMAFNMVKQMKPLGLNPRLRSYGPALSAFCNNGEIDKAFSVEKHMLEHGVYPEEPELAALLRVSMNASNAEKVYYLLHKLRTALRQVSPTTADLIITWFKSKDATRVGKVKLDKNKIKKAIENGGGGWHGLGWLGRGKWSVSSTNVGKDGLCKSCGEKLATIDLDPIETENFAESVAAIATQREKNSSFQKFQV